MAALLKHMFAHWRTVLKTDPKAHVSISLSGLCLRSLQGSNICWIFANLCNASGWALAILTVGFGAELFCWVATITLKSALLISSELVSITFPKIRFNETARD